MNYLYIAGTILFTVYGQLMLKWRLSQINIKLPENIIGKLISLFKLILDPYIFSAFASAFVASLFWMISLTKFEITKAYPFMSLSPLIVFLFGVFVFNESMTLGKILGLILIIIGTIITVKI